MRPDPRRLALLAALALVYALCYSMIKVGLQYAPPLRFAGLRAVGGGAALLVYLAVVGPAQLVPPRSTWKGIVALSIVGTVLLYGAMFMSPGVAGAGISSVLGNTGPLFAVALAAPVLGERVTGRKAGALVLGLGGISLIAYPVVVGPSAVGIVGALLPLTAAAAAAGSAVLLKWLGVGASLVSVVAWQLLLGGGSLLGLSVVLEPTQSVSWTPRFAAYLAFLALAGTAFAVSAWYWLVQREDVGRLSILITVLVPALGLGFGRVFFGEPVHPLSVVGAAIAVGGLALVVDEGATPAASLTGVLDEPGLPSSVVGS